MLRLFYFFLIALFVCFPDFANAQAKPKRDVSKDKGRTAIYRKPTRKTISRNTSNVSSSVREAYAVMSADETLLTFYCDGRKKLRKGSTYSLNEGEDIPGWCKIENYVIAKSNVKTVVFDESFKNATPLTCCQWFAGFGNLTAIKGIKYVNTEKVTNMYGMFDGCCSLTSLDLSSFDTESVTTMEYMFNGCSSLSELCINDFDTSNVKDMSWLFAGCNKLESIEIDGFETENVTAMVEMFSGCNSLTTLDLSSFDILNVTEMREMFKDCSSLTKITVDDNFWKIKENADCDDMFSGCNANLERLK